MAHWTMIVLAAACVLGTASACSEEEAGDGNGGAGGTGTGTGTTSSGTAGGPACHGDQVAWDAIQKENIACSNNSDCCVVVNDCTMASQVVHADDFAEAQSAFPWCEEACTFCIAEYIEVACVSGECVGYPEPDGTTEPKPGVSQCGVDNIDPQLPNPGLVFGCQ